MDRPRLDDFRFVPGVVDDDGCKDAVVVDVHAGVEHKIVKGLLGGLPVEEHDHVPGVAVALGPVKVLAVQGFDESLANAVNDLFTLLGEESAVGQHGAVRRRATEESVLLDQGDACSGLGGPDRCRDAGCASSHHDHFVSERHLCGGSRCLVLAHPVPSEVRPRHHDRAPSWIILEMGQP